MMTTYPALKYPAILTAFIVLCLVSPGLHGECPLDHFIIGCNPDGIWGTADDNDLFVNSWQKYRDSGEAAYENRYYPLYRTAAFITNHPYRIGEPGFDAFQATNPNAAYTYDPNHALTGQPDLDYCLSIECIALSPGLRAVHKDYPQFTIDEVGEGFNHSEIHRMRTDPHMHLSYQADNGQELRWITWQVLDILDDGDSYGPSEPCTLVFNRDPNIGDIHVDGRVNVLDLVHLLDHWLGANASIDNDYYERADLNHDGMVDLRELALLALHW